MEITIEQPALLDALSLAIRVVEGRAASTHPIMGNVLLRTDGKTLMVAASNPAATMSCEIECKVEAPGALTLNAKHLTEVVKLLSGDVRIESDDDTGAEIRCGKSRTKLAGLPPRDFPRLPDHREQKFFAVDATLVQLIGRSLFAASTDITRLNMNGIYVGSENGKVTVMACDSHRGWQGIQLAVTPPIKGVLLPRRVASDLEHLVNPEMALSKAHVFLRSGPKVLALALPEAEFPPLDNLIPKKQPIRAVVPREAMKKSVKRCALVSADCVRLSLSDDALRISSVMGNGEAEDEIAVSHHGSDFEGTCNPTYLVSALEAFEGDEIVLGLTDAEKPFTLRAAEDDGTVTVISPMRK